MGIDYDGGMIVGESGDLLDAPDDFDGEFYEWVEEVGLDCMSMYYDGGQEECYYGYCVGDVFVDSIDDGWLDDVRDKARLFEELTGVKARLIGTQDIT